VTRRVVLVDDHHLFRSGVRAELGDAVEVIGEAGSVEEAVPLIKELDPDVVLLDVHLPDGDGDAIINAVAPARPGVRFLALSVSDAAEDVIGVIRAGARGYVTKTISRAELTDAIERVAEGDAVFSPRLAGFVLDAFGSDARQGREQELAVLFADLRGFTRIAEHKLPYDVVFILNRYFEAVGGAIQRAGGIPNQFTGDGVMALFGVESGAELGCRQAVAAAREIVRDLAALNHELVEELPAPLRIGIGIHAGPAIVGRMGYGAGVYLTAVGDTVHVASRLEQLTKEYRCVLVLSEEVASRAALDVSAFPRHELTVRNRGGLLAVRVIDDLGRLPSA